MLDVVDEMKNDKTEGSRTLHCQCPFASIQRALRFISIIADTALDAGTSTTAFMPTRLLYSRLMLSCIGSR
jgi:hypothetical protein